jgi:hypothetical protein
MIETVHDGGAIPSRFRYQPDGSPLVDSDELDRRYVIERDWGASLVAQELAKALGLGGYYRVGVARVLLDFNRFPGSTPDGLKEPSERLSINPPLAHALDHSSKTDLLETYYDGISKLMESAIEGKLIKIAVHTYDEHNPSRTQRPDVSLISRSAGYQRENRMPFGVFDPLYPDVLGESMCSRTLLHRISLNLERAGFRVGHNHPYLLPDGSLEVRTQVWYYFAFLRGQFEAEFPASRDDEAYRMIWAMLLNTNLRLAESGALRGYLHRFRRVSDRNRDRFRAAQRAYEKVKSFQEESTVISDYRRSPMRPNSLALEVRKDLLCEFDSRTGRPLPMRQEMVDTATAIVQVIAESLKVYLENDRKFPHIGPALV